MRTPPGATRYQGSPSRDAHAGRTAASQTRAREAHGRHAGAATPGLRVHSPSRPAGLSPKEPFTNTQNQTPKDTNAITKGPPDPTLTLVTGIAGSGKTTLAKRIARGTGALLIDADDHHPPANIHKMRRAEPLTDADRAPWLETLADLIARAAERGENAILACSALKRAYRAHLLENAPPTRLIVHLDITEAEAEARVAARVETESHFMPGSLVRSQLATLEKPTPEEAAALSAALLTLDANQPAAELAAAAQRALPR